MGTVWRKYLNVKTFNPSIEDDKKVRTHTLKDAMILIHNNYKLGKDGKELLDLANEIMADFYSSKVELKYGVLEFLEHCRKTILKCVSQPLPRPSL